MIASNLFDHLGLIVALPGARCRGHWSLFDEARPDEAPETVDQRHAQALSLCRECPALASCQQWFDSLKPSKRPPGVIAGRIHQPRPACRPRKAVS
jgi:hypothetical protein